MLTQRGVVRAIAQIQDVFEAWRQMGHKRLRNGCELIGQIPDNDGSAWMHVLYPRLTNEALAQIEAGLGQELAPDLRTLYRAYGGMQLFCNAFQVHGLASPVVNEQDGAMTPSDIVQFNRELAMLSWWRQGVVAFAHNAWDLSVHAYLPGNPAAIHRIDRGTGKVLEQHDHLWEFLTAKLYRLDDLVVND